MLKEPTIEKLRAMRLEGMANGWLEQQKSGETASLSFDERFGGCGFDPERNRISAL